MKKIRQLGKDWEHWPFLVFYFPLLFAWCGYMLRSRAFWFFTPSNPTLSFGGFEGEAKSEMYTLMPKHYYPKSLVIAPLSPFEKVEADLQLQHFTYPFIVKPDVGMKGILFRVIENRQQLHTYHQHMPAAYLLQEFVAYPHEVSVFYSRLPGESKGCITAIIQKDLLQVTGDGVSTLQQLLVKQHGGEGALGEIKKQQGDALQQVLEKGKPYVASHIGNRLNGATFLNLTHQADETLLQLFDALSEDTQFYYGRYDIKCTSVEDMKRGRNFSILEFNGAGSVPNHIYTGGYTLLGAYREILKHWQLMYAISRANNKRGIRYWGFFKGYRFLNHSKAHFKKLKALDKTLLLK